MDSHPATGLTPRRRSLVAVWVAVAAALGGLLGLAGRYQGPLDDPDPARQRPGVLDLGALPSPAPQVTAGVPTPGRPAVVLFTRPQRLAGLCRALAGSDLGERAELAVVVAGGAGGDRCGAAAVVADPAGALAAGYGLDPPRQGGPPVGYAIVDGGGLVRYRTLDPGTAGRLGEVRTMLAALP